MALAWDVSKCKKTEDFDAISEKDWPATHAMIWYMMTVGFGKITEENWKKVYGRLLLWQHLFDADGVKVTPKVVHDRIGLYTNCTDETDTKWRNRIVQIFVKENLNTTEIKEIDNE
jgi:hypothetical protein